MHTFRSGTIVIIALVSFAFVSISTHARGDDEPFGPPDPTQSAVSPRRRGQEIVVVRGGAVRGRGFGGGW